MNTDPCRHGGSSTLKHTWLKTTNSTTIHNSTIPRPSARFCHSVMCNNSSTRLHLFQLTDTFGSQSASISSDLCCTVYCKRLNLPTVLSLLSAFALSFLQLAPFLYSLYSCWSVYCTTIPCNPRNFYVFFLLNLFKLMKFFCHFLGRIPEVSISEGRQKIL